MWANAERPTYGWKSFGVMLAISATLRGEDRQIGEVAPAGRHEDVRRLEGQVGQDADHVGVAAALAVAVDRGLDVANAGGHGGHRVGHGQLGVVVGVDAPGDGRRARVGLERAAGVARRSAPARRSASRRSCRTGRASGRRPAARHGGSRGRSRGRPCSRRRSAPRRRSPRGRDRPRSRPSRRSCRGSRPASRPRTSVTWSSQLLPKIVTTGVSAATSSRRFGSSLGPVRRDGASSRRPPAGRSPSAASGRRRRSRCPWGSSPASRPRCRASRTRRASGRSRSLSASDRMMFSPWVPSRRVVS